MVLNLDLVGKGSPSEERRLKALSQRLGISKIVHWHGPQPRSSFIAYYCQCHLLVLPAHDGPFGNVVLEAMACGRPVLGSAVGGISYLLSEWHFSTSSPNPCNLYGT